MAKITLLGTMGADAKANQVSPDRIVVNFSVCENVAYKKGSETIRIAQWFNVSYFTKSDGLVKYLLKGKKVFVSGTLKFSEYKNEVTGLTIKTNEIIADTVEPATWEAEHDAPETNETRNEVRNNDDIPF